MTTEVAINALTTQATALFDVCIALKNNTAATIAAAVVVSENAAQIPLVIVATNLIDTQTLLVAWIAKG